MKEVRERKRMKRRKERGKINERGIWKER